MSQIPKEKIYTRKQLQRRIRFFRIVMPIMAGRFGKTPKIEGKELFLQTEAGTVRVLGYNLDKQEKLPLLVNMHGGGFCVGRAEMDDPFMMNIAVSANVKILSVDYSLAPEAPFPAALHECYGVVKYAKEHPDEFGIDPEKIAAGGQSAGGNLTAAICLMDGEKKELGLKCVILNYPPTDIYTDPYFKPRQKGSLPSPYLARIFDQSYCRNKEERKNPLVSPYYATDEQLQSFPPALVITSDRDMLGPETERLKDRMMEAGVDVSFKRFKGVHAFTHNGGPEADEAWRMMIEYLKKYLA